MRPARGLRETEGSSGAARTREAGTGARKSPLYEAEQLSKQREAERVAREAAERAAAERVEAAIQYAEANGATADEVQAMLEQPAALPRPAVAATIDRVPGIIRRSTYKAEVVNLREL